MEIKRERNLSELLTSVGVPTNILGYQYLKIGIDLIIEKYNKGNWDFSVTKEIYPIIAKTCYTTASRVERSMRHAIETAFNNIELDTMNKIFKNTVSISSGRVRNHEFMARMAEYYRLNLKE